MPIVRCIPLEMPKPPPSINIPGLGQIQQARKAINDLTDPSEMLMQMQATMATALAPIKRYVDMLDAMMAVYGCMQAIPKAILTLSPDPIYDCFKKLAKAIAVLMSYLPPLAYVRMYADIAKYCMDVIKEIIGLFTDMDARAGDYLDGLAEAALQADGELALSIGCGMDELKAFTLNIFELLQMLQVFNDVITDMLLQYYPPLKDGVKAYTKASAALDQMKTAIENDDDDLPPGDFSGDLKTLAAEIPVPNLSPLLFTLCQFHNAMALLYDVVAPVAGLDADAELIDPPDLQYLGG